MENKTECKQINKTECQQIEVPVEGGKIVAYKSTDPLYPGIFIDFIGDKEGYNENVVTVEKPVCTDTSTNVSNSLRTLVWKKGIEDYVDEIKWD